jgi:predicted AAA+ superfamily ATPase
MQRYLVSPIQSDLKEKMVLLGGPRQVGKTTLALSLLKNGGEDHPAYFNWDVPGVAVPLIKGELPATESLIILDEIHKYKNWRNLIKGFYDRYKSKKKFLITGSAKLDHYRRGGDSLQGRYHFFRLHPLSLPEISRAATRNDTSELLQFGGFPEPFFKQSEKVWRRWQQERVKRVVFEDLVSLESVRDISSIELLTRLLPERVGSLLSIQSLREDLMVAHETAERWIQILEKLYFCFRISSFGHKRIRALRKDQKLYLWDWSLCKDPGTRFENMVACHLLKYCHFIEDTDGYEMELKYIRDTDKREIDFVVMKDGLAQFAVECKTADRDLSKHIQYFSERTGIPFFYQVHLNQRHTELANYRARIMPFQEFCKIEKLV